MKALLPSGMRPDKDGERDGYKPKTEVYVRLNESIDVDSIAEICKKINSLILSLSKSNWLDYTIANNYHYVTKWEKEAREVALAIKDGKKIYDESRRKPKWDFHIMSRSEIEETMKKNWYSDELVQISIENNLKIADRILTEIDLNQALFPNYESPEDIKELYERYKDHLVIE